jgi:phage FluMu gp28-like protein
VSTTIDIKLATPHVAQQHVLDTRSRFNLLACGRRWGKTKLGAQLVISGALQRWPCGWFAPTYKYLDQAWDEITEALAPAVAQGIVKANKSDRAIRFARGGRIDFWTLERGHAGRGRRYKRVVVDEAALAGNLEPEWNASIRPTLADYVGDAWFCFTPFGHNYAHRLWVRGQDDAHGDYASWQMPTCSNPFISEAEIEAARLDLPADVFAQEFLAEFLSDAANPFGLDAIRACLGDLSDGPPYVWGADLAKHQDHTVAIALDRGGRCCGFQRWRSDWRNTTSRLRNMIKHTHALVDSTGVGDPIVEELQHSCGNVEGYTFTQRSKQQLMEGLAVAIQQQRIRFPDGPIRHELDIFRYDYRPTGVRYTAPEGMHDDCVDALALATRCLLSRPAPVTLDARGGGQDDFWLRVDNEAIWD